VPPPAFVTVTPPPKSIEVWYSPTRATFPAASTATPRPVSSLTLPRLLLQMWAPSGPSFARNAWLKQQPGFVNTPPPKLTEPRNRPVTRTFPCASDATARAD
jgi:hypothetical protein